jgi:hypothetical protein
MYIQKPDTKVNTTDCRERFCTAARMDMDYVITDITNPEVVLQEATEWLRLFHKEKKLSDDAYLNFLLSFVFNSQI